MLVERILPIARERLVTIGDAAPVLEAARLLGVAHTNLVVVCGSNGTMVGVISKTDIVRRISHCLGHACAAAVSGVMTREVVACRPQDWLADVWSMMKARTLQCIPVIDAGARPLGIIYARDVLQSLLTEVQNEEELLRDYVMCVGYH